MLYGSTVSSFIQALTLVASAAPGHAPVVDACGQAGGKFARTPVGGESVYTNTTLSQMGDMGSKVLPKMDAQAVWQRGSSAEVMWGMRFNHGASASPQLCTILICVYAGGGYQYRLCSIDEELSEACAMCCCTCAVVHDEPPCVQPVLAHHTPHRPWRDRLIAARIPGVLHEDTAGV